MTPKTHLRALGASIRESRQQCGMTQQDLASRLGMKSHAHISRIENGEVEANALLVYDIAKILGTTITRLLDRADDLIEK